MSTRKGRRDLRSQFGTRIKGLRLAGKFTQEQLAEKVGISVDFLSLIERGLNAPSFDNIESLARALKRPVFDLFHFDEGDQ